MSSFTYVTLLLLLLVMYLSLQYLPVEGILKDGEVGGDAASDKIVVCYFTNWAMYRSGAAKYTPENINASLCTHINYAFAVLDNETLTMVPSDPYADIDNKFFELVTAFKEFGIKVLLSVGGWNNSVADHWSRLVSNATARALFITSVLELLEKYNFDGLDMDYEYPGCPQYIGSVHDSSGYKRKGLKFGPTDVFLWRLYVKNVVVGNKTTGLENDKENFNQLMIELKQAFDGKYLLTLATGGGKGIIDDCYVMSPLCELADWVNVMTYDYHNHLDGEVGAGAPLHGTATTFGVYETMHYYIYSLGCPAEKLVLGFPFYGRSFTLAETSSPEFGALVSGPGEAGPYTGAPGFLSYYEICDSIKSGYNVGSDKLNGSYIWNSTQFISFDSQPIVVEKTSLIMKEFNLRGAMFWSLDFDDFNNICGCGSYPLLKTINYQLGRTNTPVTCV